MNFSVITVCKNAARTIERTIQSVAEQTYRDIEYLVLDGASDDGTQAIVERNRSAVTRFVSEPDAGIYAAMNKGVRSATGDYLYFLNADDYLADPRVLADVAAFLKKDPDCDLVYGDIDIVRLSGHTFRVELPVPEYALEYLATGCLPHQGTFARAELFHTVGLFNEEYRCLADYDWFLRVLEQRASGVRYYPRHIAYFSEGGLSSTQAKLSTTEMFAIQDRFPLYRTEQWLLKRVARYQQAILYYQGVLAEGRQEDVVQQLRHAKRTIAYMEGSNFWKLRRAYLGCRRGLATLMASAFSASLPRRVAKRVGW